MLLDVIPVVKWCGVVDVIDSEMYLGNRIYNNVYRNNIDEFICICVYVCIYVYV